MARRTKEDALETREHLLDAALDVFCEKGFSQTRLSDVAERIGMTRGALYWHFKDKTALLVGLFNKIQDREEKLVRAEVPELETLEDLKAHFREHGRVLMTDEPCHKFVFFLTQQMEWSVETRAAICQEMNHMRKRPFNEITLTLEKAEKAGMLQPETDVEKTAAILISLWMGLAGNYMRGFIGKDLDQTVEIGFTMVLDAVSRPQENLPQE